PARTAIYALSLHDALPISETITLHAAPVGTPTVDVSSVGGGISTGSGDLLDGDTETGLDRWDDSSNVTMVSGDLRFSDSYTLAPDRKSTRLNSSHVKISYA